MKRSRMTNEDLKWQLVGELENLCNGTSFEDLLTGVFQALKNVYTEVYAGHRSQGVTDINRGINKVLSEYEYHGWGTGVIIDNLLCHLSSSMIEEQELEKEKDLPTMTVTPKYLSSKGKWIEYCEVTGTNEYAWNEGLVNDDTKLTLTLKQAKKLGLI